MSKWKKVRLGEITSIKTGKLNSCDAVEDGCYPFFTCAENPLRINTAAYDSESVLVAGNCTPYVNYYKGKFNAYQRTYIITPTAENLFGRWLFYWMRQEIKMMIHRQQGSVEKYFVLSDFTEEELTLPPLPTQRKIAAVLSSLDDKIENNRKICANLEAQAQAIFKSWFVDFEPFGGKMPQGWKEVPLSEVADFYGGYSYKGSELHESDCAMATIKNFERGGGFKLDGFKEIVPSSKLKSFQEVELFDTLVAHTDLTQKAEVIGNAEVLLSKAGYDRIIMSMDLVKVLPRGGMSKYLLAALLKNPAFKNHCLRYVNGTTVLHLSKAALHEYSLFLPEDLSLLSKVSDLFESVYRSQAILIDETRALAATRDALLPKLMIGEIDVEKVKVA